MTKKEIQEKFLSITNVPEIARELDSITLLSIQSEICNLKTKLDENPSFVFPSITTLTHGRVSSTDFTHGPKGEKIHKEIMNLRRKNCYYNIKNAVKLIKSILVERNGKSIKRTCKLSAKEIAEIVAEYGLNKILKNTDIVRLVYKLREIELDKPIKNTYLYRSL